MKHIPLHIRFSGKSKGEKKTLKYLITGFILILKIHKQLNILSTHTVSIHDMSALITANESVYLFSLKLREEKLADGCRWFISNLMSHMFIAPHKNKYKTWVNDH